MTTEAANRNKEKHVCHYSMAFMLDNWFRRLIQHPKRVAGEYIKEGDTVIDLGCGPGFFTIDLAKMVGPTGKVIAVDLQPEMLEQVKRKAEKHGLSERITYHQCESDNIGLKQKADFILAYYMIHETPNSNALLAELNTLLHDNGQLLAVEPVIHVSKNEFEEMLDSADKVGLQAVSRPKRKGGRSALLRKTFL